MIEGTYTETNGEYHRGFALDDYNGVISLVAAEQGKDGNIYMQWTFPQRMKEGKRVPHDKSLPLKIELGDQHEAIAKLEKVLAFLREKAGVEQNYGPIEQKPEEPDIPF